MLMLILQMLVLIKSVQAFASVEGAEIIHVKYCIIHVRHFFFRAQNSKRFFLGTFTSTQAPEQAQEMIANAMKGC